MNNRLMQLCLQVSLQVGSKLLRSTYTRKVHNKGCCLLLYALPLRCLSPVTLRTSALDELVDIHFVDWLCVGLSSHFEPRNHSQKFLSIFNAHLLYPSISCRLCHWFKCEHDYVTGLKCVYGPNDRTQFWIYIFFNCINLLGQKI